MCYYYFIFFGGGKGKKMGPAISAALGEGAPAPQTLLANDGNPITQQSGGAKPQNQPQRPPKPHENLPTEPSIIPKPTPPISPRRAPVGTATAPGSAPVSQPRSPLLPVPRHHPGPGTTRATATRPRTHARYAPPAACSLSAGGIHFFFILLLL